VRSTGKRAGSADAARPRRPACQEARELFEASLDSDFYTLMRAYQFAKKQEFQRGSLPPLWHSCADRAAGRTDVRADPANCGSRSESPEDATPRPKSEDHLLRCIMAGFIDQLCIRRDLGTLDCDLTEGRHATLMRESWCKTPTFLSPQRSGRLPDALPRILPCLAWRAPVKREWIEQTFPEQITATVEHLYDRTHKRVARSS